MAVVTRRSARLHQSSRPQWVSGLLCVMSSHPAAHHRTVA
ncbi:hypothetical protein HMPREF9622_02522 [Cutibacterium modestum HL037PA3]|nr:hypothetical protein HMPREF9622_02522 [Cutibacterium modestum HL037PA3]